jgi:CspA family cold shock protein
MFGQVKWFDEKKGFGFITTDDGQDVFVHYSEIVDQPKRQKNLTQSQRVEFDIEKSDRGLKAVNVRAAN